MERIQVLHQLKGILDSITKAFDYMNKSEPQLVNPNLMNDITDALLAIKNMDGTIAQGLYIPKIKKFIESMGEYSDNRISLSDLTHSFTDWEQLFSLDLAEEYFQEKDFQNANELYVQLSYNPSEELKAISFHRLAQIRNITDPFESYNLYKQSFEMDNKIVKRFLSKEHPSFQYTYTEIKETLQSICPFCEKEAAPQFCAESYRGISYNPIYSPIKLWMKCADCNHLFAYNTSDFLSQSKFDGANFKMMQPKVHFLEYLEGNLIELRNQVKGNRLLDVGIGGGELLAVAKELLFEAEGVEIVKIQAEYVSNMLDVKVESCDFLDFNTDLTYDLLTMGDVIEHIDNPQMTIKKAYDLLSDDGVLWISTPNFESAFSRINKFTDPMWLEAGHLHYFSFHSLKNLLEKEGFKVINYRMSKRYNGSMEVTAIKN